MEVLNQIILIRGIERILIIILSGVSMILGWSLFKLGIFTEQSGEIKTKGFLIKLSKVGPGIFFALFGCLILIQSLYSPFTYDSSKRENSIDSVIVDENTTFQYFSNDIKKYMLLSHSINTILDKIQTTTNLNDRYLLETAIKNLEEERNLWIIGIYGVEAFNLWENSGYDFIVNPQGFSDDDKKILEEIKSWMIGKLEQ